MTSSSLHTVEGYVPQWWGISSPLYIKCNCVLLCFKGGGWGQLIKGVSHCPPMMFIGFIWLKSVTAGFCVFAVHWVRCKVARPTKSSVDFISCCIEHCDNDKCSVIRQCHGDHSSSVRCIHAADTRRHLTTCNICCRIFSCKYCAYCYQIQAVVAAGFFLTIIPTVDVVTWSL